MVFLTPPDLTRIIQDATLQQLITNNQAVLDGAELQAIEEARSHLRQRYDLSATFTPVATWAAATTYAAGAIVCLNPAAYIATNTYAIGSYTLSAGLVYKCHTAGATGIFNASLFTLIGPQYQLYTALLPCPLFSEDNIYKGGDQVFWHGLTYTCLTPTTGIDHETALQFNQLQALPLLNIVPDDPAAGPGCWSAGATYSVPAGADILSPTYWAQADPRDQDMVQKVADIALYHLHSRIAPRNVPPLRVHRYMGDPADRVLKPSGDIVYPVYSALGWLQGCARGSITPALPMLQPTQGLRLRFGGNVRNVNSY
jgi:hypothetical protein